MSEINVKEDEIHLNEIFRTVWNNRLFIIFFTLAITIVSIIYVVFKTPTYEAKAILKIGEYKVLNDNFISKVQKLDNASELSAELRVLFIDLLKNNKEKVTEIKNISVLKKQKDFLTITAHSVSNELAKKEIEKIVMYITNLHKKDLDELIENRSLKLKNLEKKIDYVKNTKVVEIEDKIKYQKEVVLKSIDSKISLNVLNTKKFQKQLELTEKNLFEIKTENSTLAAINIMEKRNLEEKINRFKLELINLKNDKKNVILNILPSLERDKSNVLKSELEILLEEQKLLITSMLPHNYSNSKIVGEIITNDTPIKPKKSLTVVIGFIVGFIGSLFLIFLTIFIRKINIEKNR